MEESRIDYVVVCDSTISKSEFLNYIVKFIQYLESRGLKVEIKRGNIKENIYLVINLPPRAIRHFALVYRINIHNPGHTVIPVSTINLFSFKCFQTALSHNRDIFTRRGKITNLERIQIAHEILKTAKFGNGEDQYGIQKLISLRAVKTAYPLHDGECGDEFDGGYQIPQNDRQLLLKYWANFSLWYKEQPLNLIAKYFGTEVAFYFAWLGFYNRMLIPAAIVGIICSVFSIIQLRVIDQERVDDICTSHLVMCPICHSSDNCIYTPLNISCESAKLAVIFDNPATVFFAVFMSFWATFFINLWKRFENTLKIRWNVEFEEYDTQVRLEYKERSTHRKLSTLTGTLEPYTPRKIKVLYVTLSYGTCLLLMGIVVIFVFGVIMYRITMAALIRTSDFKPLHIHSTFLLTVTSACLQVIFIKIFGRVRRHPFPKLPLTRILQFYSEMSEWLTNLENPRTQSEFDNSVMYKRYFLGFANNYASLFYIAFMKSRFYSPDQDPALISVDTDLCDPTGCLMSLCVQLSFLMLLKSLTGNILTLTVPKIITGFRQTKETDAPEAQWESEYRLYPAGRYLLTTEFVEMIIQYGFVTFFVAAFPLAPLCALLNNWLELRLDAYKLVTRYRRPVPKQQSGIGAWNDILGIITHLSVATNAFVLAFTSDFVVRQIYIYQHGGSLDGYINSTLSIYDMRDHNAEITPEARINPINNSSLCYYKGLRFPPDHPKKYQLTPSFWYEMGMRLVCVIVFEHIIMLTNGIVSYFIPQVPQSVKETLHYERTKDRELQMKIKNDNLAKVRHRRTKLKINRSEYTTANMV
ncbi:anoctamin-4-like isoform X4 [Tenebrio molitor]|uniref:anoctamin-4-like isoform X4 n=1 Tax=Tenebrio molitor TaxID=7067 RepID=UPI0036247C2D